ncbi:hypothetical protein [Trinickia sp.]|uniref:hypothetical protein n=1 Tax=Trinickia sp. TaxID=2571163 RepID=UPI003F7EFC40
MHRPHPKKDIEAALVYAEIRGWRVQPRQGNGHAWGKMLCPYNDVECRCGEFCITSIWSTPRCPASHARTLKRVVDHCAAANCKTGSKSNGRQET